MTSLIARGDSGIPVVVAGYTYRTIARITIYSRGRRLTGVGTWGF